jgi:hypothetical protein
MAIKFHCACGKTLQVKDELGGRRVRCPACSDAVTVPKAEAPAFEVVEDEPEPEPVRARVVAERRDDDGEDRKRRRRREDDDDDEDRPKKRKKFKSRAKVKKEEHSHFAIEKGILNSGVAGGLAAMVGAVVWFVIGLMNDWIFYYPPILFVIGLIAFIRGLVEKE